MISSDGTLWTNRPTGTTNSLNAVAWVNGKLIVAGDELMVTSTDTISWSSQTMTNLVLNSVAYGNGTFVVGGRDRDTGDPGWSGVLLSSDDGVAWTRRFATSTISYSPRSIWVAFGNGVFVGVGWPGTCACPLPDGGDHILRSTDGVNWTVVNSGLPNGPYYTPLGLFGVGYAKNTFVAVGPIGEIALSTDGSAWEQISPDSYDHFYDVASGGQTFVAVGAHGAIYSSVGGDSWIRQNSPVTDDLTFEIESPQEAGTIEADHSTLPEPNGE